MTIAISIFSNAVVPRLLKNSGKEISQSERNKMFPKKCEDE